MKQKVPRVAVGVIRVFQKVDQGATWSGLGRDKTTAQLLMNRGFIENERTGPMFGDVRPRLTQKAQKFRQFY